MKPKHQRLVMLVVCVAALGAAATATFYALRENMVFFNSPTELLAKQYAPDQRLRIGGLVEQGSVVKDGNHVRFRVTDMTNSVPVSFRGILPDLFREGQGVVAQGTFNDGVFTATEVLAKHDETYMPAEVVDALKKSGEWKPEAKKK